MPLHVARLRDSDLASEESPEACWYAVLLWSASWHQLPAASLPDNDAVLTKLIGLGRDVRTFLKHKAGALRGFVLCSDGRLYHPMVAEQAIIAWNSKLKQRWQTECARIKKRNQRDKTDTPLPTFEEFLSSNNPNPGPQSVPRDEGESPEGHYLQETGTGTGISREEGSNDPPSLSPTARAKGGASPIPEGFPSESDIEVARGWIAEAGVRLDPAEHARRFRNYSLSRGRELADWGAGWRGWIEIEIGKAPALPAPDAASPVVWEGPPEVWDLAVARKSLDWARSYIGGCAWTGGGLETRSLTAAKAIKAAIGDDLNDRGWTIVHAGQAEQAAA